MQKVLLLFALLVSHIDRDCLSLQSSGYSRPESSTCVVGATTHKNWMQRENHKHLKGEITNEHKLDIVDVLLFEKLRLQEGLNSL